MTATIPEHTPSPARLHERWFDDALTTVQEVARRLVPGCDSAAIDLIRAEGAHPSAHPTHSDTASVALLSGPMNEGGQLLGVLHLFSRDQPFGPAAAEPVALVARLTAAIVTGHAAADGGRR